MQALLLAPRGSRSVPLQNVIQVHRKTCEWQANHPCSPSHMPHGANFTAHHSPSPSSLSQSKSDPQDYHWHVDLLEESWDEAHARDSNVEPPWMSSRWRFHPLKILKNTQTWALAAKKAVAGVRPPTLFPTSTVSTFPFTSLSGDTFPAVSPSPRRWWRRRQAAARRLRQRHGLPGQHHHCTVHAAHFFAARCQQNGGYLYCACGG
jgi:hypothetical protein